MKARILFAFFLKSYSGEGTHEFTKRVYFLSSFIAFAGLGYNPLSLPLWTAVNWSWIGLELSAIRFAAAKGERGGRSAPGGTFTGAALWAML